MKRIFYLALFYLIFGLSIGVFYREFTRAMDFEGNTTLSFVHPHILTMGFLFFILVLVLNKNFKLTESRHHKHFLVIYNIGLVISVLAMISRGMLEVFAADLKALSYIAGIGHIILATGLAFFMVNLYSSIKSKKHTVENSKK